MSVPILNPLTVGDILDQSLSLYRKNFSLMIGIVALVQVPLLALALGLSYRVLLSAFASSAARWLLLVASALSGVIGALLLPISVGAITLMYYDLRVRKEGLALQMMVQQLVPALGEPSA